MKYPVTLMSSQVMDMNGFRRKNIFGVQTPKELVLEFVLQIQQPYNNKPSVM